MIRLPCWFNNSTEFAQTGKVLVISCLFTADSLNLDVPIKLHKVVFFSSMTNKMQRYTIFFIIVNALHVSGGFSAHHQELKNCTLSIAYVPSLLAATASGSSKQAWHIRDAECTVFDLLTMGGETARNM